MERIKIKTPFFSIMLLLVALASSCQNKAANTSGSTTNNKSQMDVEKFYWQENINSPLGYPVEVYKGGLESSDGNYVSLSIGPDTGNWGELGSGMSTGVKPVPNRLNLTWISYAENVFYDIDTLIDYEKLVKLFKEGYEIENRKFGRKREEYTIIMTGFAPGGVVVVWIAGAGKQVEIGRYQATPIEIPQEEIDKLDSHDKLLFDEANVKRIMSKESYVPLEVQKANAGKPIPFGLWDAYRISYDWKIEFLRGEKGKIAGISYVLFNGERQALLSENFNEKEYVKRAIPKELALSWRDETGQLYGGSIRFSEDEIFKAFATIYKKNPQAKVTLQLSVNKTNTFITASLKTEDHAVDLKENDVDVFKSRRE